MASIFLIPILALVVGIGSLYFDPQSTTNPQSTLKTCLIAALLIICILGIFDKKKDQFEITKREMRIESLIDILKNFRTETKITLQEIKNRLSNFGMLSPQLANITQIQESFDAEKERDLLATKETISRRESVILQYFPKNVDVDIVKRALIEIGFQLKIGETRFPKIPTNAIFYGDSVNIDDVKLVAYTLIRAGIEIKIIQPFHSSEGRSNIIQVGSLRDATDEKPLTIEEIKKTKVFKVQY